MSSTANPPSNLASMNSSPTQPTSVQIPHSTAEISPTHSTGDYEKWAPGLERVNKTLSPDKIQQEMKSRRFMIAVDSVYYYSARGGESKCAVLLTTQLLLRHNDKFAYASVPLVATTHFDSGSESASTDAERSVGFFEHFPDDPEYFEVGRVSGTKDTSVKPTVKVEAGIGGVEFAGVGQETHQSLVRSYRISLTAIKTDAANAPRHIEWAYEDPYGIFYPRKIRLLVIVGKVDRSSTSVLFPFDLILKKELIVELHGISIRDAVSRFIGKPKDHEGWRFRIKGNYESKLAKAAHEEAKKIEEAKELEAKKIESEESSRIPHPTLYGLRAGATSWARASDINK